MPVSPLKGRGALPGLGVHSPCHADPLILPQGIERLKRKHQPREHRGSWKAVEEAFGGAFSLNWFNPFSGPCHPAPLSDEDWVRQVADTNMETEEQSEDRKDEDSVEVTDE